MNILLIEPDKMLADIYVQALEAAGHKLDWQSGAQAAVQAADRSRPDIILLELNLNGHNGVEFLYEFRSYPEWQTIPIIINSFLPRGALSVSESAWKSLNIAKYLYKPHVSLDQLVQTVSAQAPISAK